MRSVPTAMTDTWNGGVFTGLKRAWSRATIQVVALRTFDVGNYETYATLPFAQPSRPMELPNLRRVRWQRTTDADAGTCTLELYNTKPLDLGVAADLDGDFDQPGYYTPNRGATYYNRWHYSTNEWQNVLMPDRLIRTYEGYGVDWTVSPAADPHMMPSGVWLIDKVEFRVDGIITVTCRDLARLLIEQIMYLPVVPSHYYPLSFEVKHDVTTKKIVDSGGWTSLTYSDDSAWFGGGGSGDTPYVPSADYPIDGHHPHDAFDTDASTYWLSIGNDSPAADYSFEWIEGTVSGTVSAVRVRTWQGPYRCYISVKAPSFRGANADGWVGQSIVPYDKNPNDTVAAPNHANIPYVTSFTTEVDDVTLIKFDTPITGVQAVRLTFTNLFDSGIGQYPYRAGVRTFEVSTAVQTVTDVTTSVGNFVDYSDIVKRLLAYGGFWWPADASADVVLDTVGSHVYSYATPDAVLQAGRIWGDIMLCGTGAYVGPDGSTTKLDITIWDKKPLMDGINYIRDVLGYIFYVDEMGGAVFRFPNVTEIGNYQGDLASGQAYVAGLTGMVDIDERDHIIGLSATLDSQNLREHVFVANTSGSVGAVVDSPFGDLAHGQPPAPNFRRVGGWTDTHFDRTEDCATMADLIVRAQMFTYRTDGVTIPGYPKIQIDDQVRIFEAVTGEDFVHYVKGITSDWSYETGQWTYALDTNWLGGEPNFTWAFSRDKLNSATSTYLAGLRR